jgi:hypothetical protein
VAVGSGCGTVVVAQWLWHSGCGSGAVVVVVVVAQWLWRSGGGSGCGWVAVGDGGEGGAGEGAWQLAVVVAHCGSGCGTVVVAVVVAGGGGSGCGNVAVVVAQ